MAGRIDLEGADKAEKDIDRLDKKGKGFAGKLGGFAKKAAKGAAIIGGAMVAAGGAAFAMTNKITSGFNDISKTSTKMGVTTDTYQEMKYWADQNGIATNQMEKAYGRLTQRMGRAADGNEKYSDALTALGIDMNKVKNGTITTEDAFAKSIKTLSEMTNSQEQSAAASELFGTKMARDLMPALQDGSLSIDEAKDKAHELGVVMSEDTIDAGVAFQDNMTDLKASLSAVGKNIMVGLIPIFNTMTDWILDHMPQIQAVFQTVFGVINTVFSTAIEFVQSLIAWISTLFESSQETMTGIWEVIQMVFQNIIEFLTETWEFIMEMWNEYGETIVEYVVEYFTLIYETVETIFTAVWGVIKEVLNIISPFIEKTLKKIFKFWDENGRQIMDAVSNVFAVVQKIIETVMPFVTGVIEGAWAAISGVFGSYLDIIMGLIKTFSALFTGNWSGLWEGIKETTSAIWKGIVNVIKAPINVIIGLVNGLIGALNKIKIKVPKVPDWIPGIGGKGGGTIGFDIPKIPSLATGGVLHDPTLAMVGDAGAGNPEIVTPEKLMEKIVRKALNDHGGATESEVVSYADMFRGAIFNIRSEQDIEKLAKKLGDYINKQKRKAGIV